MRRAVRKDRPFLFVTPKGLTGPRAKHARAKRNWRERHQKPDQVAAWTQAVERAVTTSPSLNHSSSVMVDQLMDAACRSYMDYVSFRQFSSALSHKSGIPTTLALLQTSPHHPHHHFNLQEQHLAICRKLDELSTGQIKCPGVFILGMDHRCPNADSL